MQIQVPTLFSRISSSTLGIVNLSPIGLTCHRVNWNHSHHHVNAREFIPRVVVVHDIVAAAAVQVGVRYEPGETLELGKIRQACKIDA
jgi:hypothetical protein